MLFIFVLTFGLIAADQNIGKAEFTDPKVEDSLSKGFHIGRGRTKRFVELDGSQTGTNYPACELPDGKPGLCKPPNLCSSQSVKNNYITFTDNLCINEKKIGICCPSSADAVGLDGLAGDLPAIAAKNEDEYNAGGSQPRGCGLSTRANAAAPGTRISQPREWPWMVSITPPGFEQYCGGVLITDSHVLTAAHCTRRWQAEELEVRLGEYDFRRTNDSRSFNFKVVSKREHESFDLSTYWNDIAILKLHRPAVFSTYVWPICLTPIGLDLVNQSAYITGWGTQAFGANHSTVLMEVSVPIWNLEECIDSFTDTVFEENICAGDYSGGKDACQGDSGGPLMYQMSSGRWAVIGIVSWGVRCGEANHPGVYTRVDKYLPWIFANTAF